MTARSGRYHHGDLHAALVARGLEVTREHGPASLSLREVTRLEGVSAAAAYRHFQDRSALLRVVSHEIQDAMVRRMRRRMRAPAGAAALDRALLRLRGVGLGYIAFAVAEPGWFETAFFGEPAPAVDGEEPDRLAPPFALLMSALDDLVAAGGLTAERREGAEFVCWSAVHGCAELMVHGPLRGADGAVIRRISERVVDDVIDGVR